MSEQKFKGNHNYQVRVINYSKFQNSDFFERARTINAIGVKQGHSFIKAI